MITHAYVRYKDDKRVAVVSISDIQNFKARHESELKPNYWVKWTEDDGSFEYYRAQILLLGESEEDVKAKVQARRVRVARVVVSESDTEEERERCEKKKETPPPKYHLMKVLNKKKKQLHEAQKHPVVNKENECCSAAALVSALKQRIEEQDVELARLRQLNADLQDKVIAKMDAFVLKPETSTDSAGATTESTPPLPIAISPPCSATEGSSLLTSVVTQNTSGLPLTRREPDMVDIGQGVCIPSIAWKRIQQLQKDSIFVKELLVMIWEPAKLIGRSLQGKHSPRFPDRPRKEPLSPTKVTVIRECYKKRLLQNGLPEGMLPAAVKQLNRYIVEKLADLEKQAKKSEKITESPDH